MWRRPPRRLSPGSHGLSPETVAESQRVRLLEAMAVEAGRRGYAGTTVAAVVRRAGVSRQTLYDHFPSKDACFVAACDDVMEHVASLLTGAYATEGPPQRRFVSALRTFMGFCARDPAIARALLVELGAAGRTGFDRRVQHLERTRALVACALGDVTPDPPLGTAEMVVGALCEIAGARLVSGRAAELPALVPELTRALLPEVPRAG